MLKGNQLSFNHVLQTNVSLTDQPAAFKVAGFSYGVGFKSGLVGLFGEVRSC